MKSTGIVRGIDALGRIVLPKELRTSMHLDTDTKLEIFVDGDSIVLKKHRPAGSCNRKIVPVALCSVYKKEQRSSMIPCYFDKKQPFTRKSRENKAGQTKEKAVMHCARQPWIGSIS